MTKADREKLRKRIERQTTMTFGEAFADDVDFCAWLCAREIDRAIRSERKRMLNLVECGLKLRELAESAMEELDINRTKERR